MRLHFVHDLAKYFLNLDSTMLCTQLVFEIGNGKIITLKVRNYWHHFFILHTMSPATSDKGLILTDNVFF